MGSDQLRILQHPILGPSDHVRQVSFTFNGQSLTGHEGESIAAALWANGIRAFQHDLDGSPMGLYCGIGHCYECRVTVNGQPDMRSCITPLSAGMVITQELSAEVLDANRPADEEGGQP